MSYPVGMKRDPGRTIRSPKATRDAARHWNALLAPYRRPDFKRSVFQLANTVLPLAIGWYLMLQSLAVGYWLTLLLALPVSGLVIRLFIIQHDCGHGSFFKSRRLRDAVGFAIGVVTLVPYEYWRKTHAIHHATSGNLHQRSFGDIDTLTVEEYLGLSRWKRLAYRFYRNPVVLLLLGPFYQFVIKHRLPLDTPWSWKREWRSVLKTNLALAVVVVVMWQLVGIQRFLLVQVPITLLSGSLGVFLFYVQHQYEETYWRWSEQWDYYHAGLTGSSHLVLPRILQWFTGNIGLHHIHHISSQIPNYFLQRCFDENPEFQQVTQLGLWDSVKTLRLSLWDERCGRLVGFRDLARRPGCG